MRRTRVELAEPVQPEPPGLREVHRRASALEDALHAAHDRFTGRLRQRGSSRELVSTLGQAVDDWQRRLRVLRGESDARRAHDELAQVEVGVRAVVAALDDEPAELHPRSAP